jgi:hypothetical protein
MSNDRAVKDRWIQRVLGVTVGATGSPKVAADTAIKSALVAFDLAQEVVDAQISQLQAKLRGTDDPDLHRIAEFGLNAISGNMRVKVQASLLTLRSSLPNVDPKAAANTRKLVDQMAAHLNSDGKVAACDRNPFGVKVSIAQTLGGALRQIATALDIAA